MWFQCNGVQLQLLTSVAFTLLQKSFRACAEQNHNVRAGAVLLLARPLYCDHGKKSHGSIPRHFLRAVKLPRSSALPIIPCPIVLPFRSHICDDNHTIAFISDKRFGLGDIQRRVLKRDAAISRKGENSTTVLSTFPGTSLRSRSVGEQSGERIPR
jgi:hypothetical protein